MGILSRLFGNSANDSTDNPGVYRIRNTVNGKEYIGGTTTTFTQRWYYHRNDLRCNRHRNKRLQADWNQYGEDVFSFEIIEVVNGGHEAVFERERYWQEKDFHSQNRYCTIDERPRGEQHKSDEGVYYPAYIQLSEYMPVDKQLEFLALCYYANGDWCHTEKGIIKLLRKYIPEDEVIARIRDLRDGFTPVA